MQTKYDRIGFNYNETRKPDPYLAQRLIELLDPKPTGLYLDIGCGTGNYTSKIQQRGIQLIGIDPSMQMLNKAKQLNSEIKWIQATAEDTSLASNSIDGIICSLCLHHWTSLSEGFKEMNRVLKEDGHIVIFTATSEQMQAYWLNHYFPKMLEDSINQMPSNMAIETAIEKAGLKIDVKYPYSIRPDLEDKFLYCGKQNPELYFDEKIRKGISSFSDLSNKEEVKRGLKQLRIDIDTGKIKEVMDAYTNEKGDYLHLVVKKN